MIKNKRGELSTLKVDQNSTKEEPNIIDENADEENKSESSTQPTDFKVM